mgnify:CR=1 FL=1
MPQNKLILLVEDDEADAVLMHRLIRILYEDSEEYVITVERCDHGGEALARLIRPDGQLQHPIPDLVMLDLRMPVLDGFDVLAAMKSQDKTRRVPIVVLSTSDADGDITRAYKLGTNGYLVKPVRANTFRHMVSAAGSFWLEANLVPR